MTEVEGNGVLGELLFLGVRPGFELAFALGGGWAIRVGFIPDEKSRFDGFGVGASFAGGVVTNARGEIVG